MRVLYNLVMILHKYSNNRALTNHKPSYHGDDDDGIYCRCLRYGMVYLYDIVIKFLLSDLQSSMTIKDCIIISTAMCLLLQYGSGGIVVSIIIRSESCPNSI